MMLEAPSAYQWDLAVGRRALLEGLAATALGLVGGAGVAARSARQSRRMLVEKGLLERTRLEGELPRGLALSDRMSFYGVKGLQIAVVEDGRVDWSGSYGLASPGGPAVDRGTLFQAGSISKPVTALAALRLAQHRRVSLDQDLREILKSWRLPPSEFDETKAVTLREALSHTAGLNMPKFLGYRPGTPLPTAIQTLSGDAPANSGRLLLEAIPGSRWRYSGGGYLLIQQALEDTTQTPFRKLMREAVLGPAGMSSSTFDLFTPAERSGAASGHDMSGNVLPEGWFMLPEAAAAGLWSTASDLAALIIEIKRSIGGQSGALLSRALATEMVTPVLNDWGLGLELAGEGDDLRFMHSGGTQGYRSLMLGFVNAPRGLAILTNGEIGDQLIAEIVRGVAKAYGWGVYPQRVRAVAKRDPARALLAGTYRAVSDDGTASLITVGVSPADELTASVPVWGGWQRPRVLHRASADLYFIREDSGELGFFRRADGVGREIALSNFAGVSRAVRLD